MTTAIPPPPPGFVVVPPPPPGFVLQPPSVPSAAQPADSGPSVAERGSILDPLVGQGLMMGWGDEAKAGVRAAIQSLLSDKTFGDVYGRELASNRADLESYRGRHPVVSPVAEIAGAVAPALVTGGAAIVPRAGAGIVSRMLAGAGSGAGYGTVYGAGAAEGDVGDRAIGGVMGAGLGAITGGAAPLAVRGVQAAGRSIRNNARRLAAPVRGMANAEGEAARRVAMARAVDDRTVQPRLTPADEAQAVAAGQPILNIDRGGETTRALARSAANTSPEARAVMETAIQDRFATQGDRTMDTVRRIVRNPTAAASRERLQRQARTANQAAYRTAYRDGERGLWSPELERITSSPAVVSAMRSAAERGRDRAVTEGFGGFNPGVTVDASGIVTFRRGANGVPTYPNLQYWDYAKRELDDMASAARRAGRNEEAHTLSDLSMQLRGELDRLVPSFADARAGAARFFRANDALEAGEQFLVSRMRNDDARNALARMSAPERRLFSEGFADALVRRVNETGDRRNVINSIFLRSGASRTRIRMALGSVRARELEAFLRVEDLMDRARTAITGNSTTARQLTELGIAGGAGGYGAMTGDWRTTGLVLGGLLVRRGVAGINRNVAAQVGRMLASPDPAVVQRGLNRVARDDRLMNALRAADIPAAIGGTQQAIESVQPAPMPGQRRLAEAR